MSRKNGSKTNHGATSSGDLKYHETANEFMNASSITRIPPLDEVIPDAVAPVCP